MSNPYLDLTEEFNRGRLRVLLSSGQAVVVHRLAIMSKDGDWILREQQSAIDHVLAVLESHGAHYRFGAPLALPWLAGGWSSHFEFAQGSMRIRTDFVSRPPRIGSSELAAMWNSAERTGSAVVGIVPLARIKLTNRDKDYAVVGEIARLMRDPADQLRFSRSARDLIDLIVSQNPVIAAEAVAEFQIGGRRQADYFDALPLGELKCRAVGGLARRTGKQHDAAAEKIVVREEIINQPRGNEQRAQQCLNIFRLWRIKGVGAAAQIVVVDGMQSGAMFGTVEESLR